MHTPKKHPPVNVEIPRESLASLFKEINEVVSSLDIEKDKDTNIQEVVEGLLSPYEDLTEFTANQLLDVFAVGELSPDTADNRTKNKGFYLLDREVAKYADDYQPVMRIRRNEEGEVKQILDFGYIANYYSEVTHNEELDKDYSKTFLFLTEGKLETISHTDVFINILNYMELYLMLINFVNDLRLSNLNKDEPSSIGLLSHLGFGNEIEKEELYHFPDQYYSVSEGTPLQITPFVIGTVFKDEKENVLFKPVESDDNVLLEDSVVRALPWFGDYYTANMEGEEQSERLRLIDIRLSRKLRDDSYHLHLTNDNQALSVSGVIQSIDEETGTIQLHVRDNESLTLNVVERGIRWRYEYEYDQITFINLDDEIHTSLSLGDYELLTKPGLNVKFSSEEAFDLIKKKKASLIYIDPTYTSWTAIRFTDRNNLHQRCLSLMGVSETEE